MVASVGIRVLQQNASKVVARAAAGEEIEITERGRPVARLVPLAPSRAEELVQSGRMRPARRRLSKLPDLVRIEPGQPTASEILADMRDEER